MTMENRSRVANVRVCQVSLTIGGRQECLPHIRCLSEDIPARVKFVQILYRHTHRLAFTAFALLLAWSTATGQSLVLKDGRKLDGKYAEIASVAENALSSKAGAGEVALTPLLVIDDGLRRIFIHSGQVAKVLEPASAKDVRINVQQPVAETGA